MSDSSGSQVVAVLLYPGCIFFEIALAAEQLASQPQPYWEGLRFERADVVVDGLLIKAQPWAHAAFAAAVAQALGVLDAEQAQALVAYQRRSCAQSV